MTQLILTEKKNGILQIIIHRPEKMNAINLEMYGAMTEALLKGDSDPEVKVMILRGSGGNFTSGNDLKDFQEHPLDDQNNPAFQFIVTLPRIKKPLIAMVEGMAVGIGTTMLLHCDLVYASEQAKLHLPFINLGLCPEAASSYLLPKMAGHQVASELLMLGEPFKAEKAVQAGIVNEVFPQEVLEVKVMEKASVLAKKPAQALKITKSLLKKQGQAFIQQTMVDEIGHFMALLKSEEAKAAFQAFFKQHAG